ncbi:hypothetical protein [Methylobacterium nodulans]|uniref:HTH cro/C1-type domain-containing protein n=1 Tax=Methylobacterium nodulans (strain LMG 21967 / CNCM I-2342 / ORS 2060) TaxID=460265 RepID=B8IIX8_METNO|nr:hypothetical protein [Methylobacterium nodulans]ACL61773.1 conserved hypothetical protein [Methylobacterium nodulans ORS 2060]
MTPDRFRECLSLLRWSQRGLAEALECDDRLVRRWATGEVPIPCGLAAWLETLGQVHAAAPPPKTYRRRSARAAGEG